MRDRIWKPCHWDKILCSECTQQFQYTFAKFCECELARSCCWWQLYCEQESSVNGVGFHWLNGLPSRAGGAAAMLTGSVITCQFSAPSEGKLGRGYVMRCTVENAGVFLNVEALRRIGSREEYWNIVEKNISRHVSYYGVNGYVCIFVLVFLKPSDTQLSISLSVGLMM